MPANCLPVPHLEQNADGDCLPACVAMVLAYLQEPIDIARVAHLLDTQEFGSLAPHIRKVAEWGYAVTYQSGSLALLRDLIASAIPPIAFVWTGDLPYWSLNTPHAFVIVGLEADTVWVNDPALATAPQSIPVDDFLLAWAEFDNRYAAITRR
jgi:ABC-type bacteriocin/lantibiotic exporter with double-glycine peptidase domain